MSSETQLYERIVTPAGRVTYREWTPPLPMATVIPEEKEGLTNGQIVTLGVMAAVTALKLLETHIPPHKVIYRKLEAVEQAILSLASGNGEQISKELVDRWADTWNECCGRLTT